MARFTIWGRPWRLLDPHILVLTILLVLIGLAAIYSVTINIEAPDYTKVLRQLIFAGMGLLLFFGASFFDYRYFKATAWIAYGLGFVLLTSVLIIGTEIRGTTGWFEIGSLTFQPVELAKILLVIFLSYFFSKHNDSHAQWRMIIVSGLAVVVYMVLTILQPDLGSAVLLLAIWVGMLLFTKVKKQQLLWLLMGVIIVSVISWNFLLYDYQQDRVLTFFNPSLDPLGQGYNVTQSIVAIGSGQFFGRGLGLGTQSQLNFLPEAEEDFIFAVIAEELGLFGVVLLLSLFSLLFRRLYKAIKLSYDNFSYYLVLGISLMLFIQIFVNIGTNLGLLPVAGVPLPFISAGGSSLLVNLLALGIVESVIIHRGGAVGS
ncbi:MAG: rod shape-determining protein RodA [Patescibacteria group bacterium]